MRSDEERCPFCNDVVATTAVSVAPALPLARLGRAAIVAFGTLMAAPAMLAGCGDDSAPADSGVGPLYGGPPIDAAAADDTGGPAPAYGAPAPDGG